MAKSDRSTRQRSWPLLYSISFLKPRLWVSLAECCNFFHIPQLQSNSYIVTCWEGASRGLSAPTKWDSSNTRTPPPAPPWSPPNTVRDIERYLGAPGYGRTYRGYGDCNLYSKWMQPNLWSRRVSMCMLVTSDFFIRYVLSARLAQEGLRSNLIL